MTTKNKRIVVAGGLVAIIASGLLAFYFFWLEPGKIQLPLVENCSLHREPCTTSLPGGGRLTFEISPKYPAPAVALQLSASFQHIDVDSVGVRFKGVDMNMGYLEYFIYELSRQDTSVGSILFTGPGGVFACTSNLMKWHVLVSFRVGETVYEVPFGFETQAPPGFIEPIKINQ